MANILTSFAFFIHTFVGDQDIKEIEPGEKDVGKQRKQEIWTMVRCGWHWISFDLLFATIGLGIINFTEYFSNKKCLLDILAIYFLGYGIVFVLVIFISKKFPGNYSKLGQWFLLWLISGLIYWGNDN